MTKLPVSKPKRKLTPKQRVLRKYPTAYSYRYAGPSPFCIYSGEVVVLRGRRGRTYNRSLNVSDATVQAAWSDAARRISRKER